ncbi:hypothetical protein MPSEU_000014900 [Mayamaea pseudoterrestris]|nr:hypothetical protein MPSEU_000014900 [Mayamaea pseudoterrestris]
MNPLLLLLLVSLTFSRASALDGGTSSNRNEPSDELRVEAGEVQAILSTSNNVSTTADSSIYATDDVFSNEKYEPLATFSKPVSEETFKLSHQDVTIQANSDDKKLNILIITMDQLRYDYIQFIQESMPIYKDKLHVKTPNIDRLAKDGVWFQNAYSQFASCAPARATLRTGCTIERHGIEANRMLPDYTNDPIATRKINSVRTYDQILFDQGYEAESFGKFHLPARWYRSADNSKNAISYNTYDLDMENPIFDGEEEDADEYLKQVAFWVDESDFPQIYQPGMQNNVRTSCLYTPIKIDPRYQKPYSERAADFSMFGVDSLPPKYSLATYTGRQGQLAIQRLAQQSKPWVLTVSFDYPHSPWVVSEEYAQYYLENQQDILTPPNMQSKFDNDWYASKQRADAAKGFRDPNLVQGFSAVYMGMIEQVDEWIGVLLDELDRQGVSENTLVAFTSDHGEFLGAHGMGGKLGLIEEALRVPFLMRLPGKIEPGTVVSRPVGAHLNLLATILDYAGLSSLDKSDGTSLRPLIAGSSYNELYDDDFCVSEDAEVKKLGEFPNFMIRYEHWKLLIAKSADYDSQDMMYNLATDPYEMNNLLSRKKQSLQLIGKAEHLRCLLVEWMLRQNGGAKKYYSSPKYNNGEGHGDIQEVTQRRSWNEVAQWISDSKLRFNPPVMIDGKWRSNAFLYVGRTTSGTLTINDISLKGTGREYFSLSRRQGVVHRNGHLRIRVAFASESRVDRSDLLGVRIVIRSDVSVQKVVIVPWDELVE